MQLPDMSTVTHHPMIERIAEVLELTVGREDKPFFRLASAYFISKVSSSMRAKILTQDRGTIPVNMYSVMLATSGYGKTHSVNILDKQIFNGFKQRFQNVTFPQLADKHMWKLAINESVLTGKSENEEKEKFDKEFAALGAAPFAFSSATVPAIKQVRRNLLLANAGSINLEIDEIGSNLVNSTDVLNELLELYDQGLVNDKLIKSTVEQKRVKEIPGKTPTNALFFGTDSKLLDGGFTEDAFYQFLETGYARRCLFAFGKGKSKNKSKTPEELYDLRCNPAHHQEIKDLHDIFYDLADPMNFDWTSHLERDMGIALVSYQLQCENIADSYPEHDTIRKAEMAHRYSKVLKLAGALAFLDKTSIIDDRHLYPAIKLVEESGEAFEHIITREKPYVRVAKYLADVRTEQTHADLCEAFSFYTKSAYARKEMLSLASAWGLKNNIIIKTTFVDGIELFKGESLEETTLDKLSLSVSNDIAENYKSGEISFDKLITAVKSKNLHWCNHGFNKGHRSNSNVIPGFNLLVLDIDGDLSLNMAHELFKDYCFITYTTKRHLIGEEINGKLVKKERFRLIFPMKYKLQMDVDTYKEFMNNVFTWLPFDVVDTGSNQAARKWLTNDKAIVTTNKHAPLFDPLYFIPDTSKNEGYNKEVAGIKCNSSLERFFLLQMSKGNRNNTLIKYALALLDSGKSYKEIKAAILETNKKIKQPMTKDEIENTIMQTIGKRINK